MAAEVRQVRRSGSEYDAFISYSHSQDKLLAEALQSELQRFARPWYRPRALRVFRDATNLAASPGLWPDIEKALAGSEWFVLMASPASAQSTWVLKEIGWWAEHRSTDRILIALTDGEIRWTETGPDWSQTTALHSSLAEVFTREYLHIDLRVLRPESSDAKARPQLGDAVAEFAAPIHGRDKDTLVGEHVRQQRRTRRTVRGVGALLTVLLLVAVVAAGVAFDQRGDALTQSRVATARQLAATSQAMLDSELDLAQLLAVEAYRMNPEPQTRSALFRAVTSSPHLVRFLPAGGDVSAIAASADGTVVVAGTSAGKLLRWEIRSSGARVEVAQLGAKVNGIAVSKDGSVAAAVSDRGAVAWQRGKGTQQVDIAVQNGEAAIAVSPSGRYVAVPSSATGTKANGELAAEIAVVDRRTGETRKVQNQRGTLLLAMPGDDELLSISPDGAWERWSGSTLSLQIYSERDTAGAHGFGHALSPNGAFFGITSGGPSVSVWRTTEPAELGATPELVAQSHGNSPQAIAISSDGAHVAVADAGTIYMSAVTVPGDTAPQLALTGNGSVTNGLLAFLGDNDHLVSVNGDTLAIWDLTQPTRIGKKTAITMPFACSACAPPQVVPRPDGKAFVALDGNHSVTVSHSLEDRSNRVLDSGEWLLGWSSDGTELFVADAERRVEVRSRDGKVISRSEPVGSAGAMVSARKDGKQVVLVDNDGTVRVWDIPTSSILRTVPGIPGATVSAESADPSGSVVAMDVYQGEKPGWVQVVDVDSGQVRKVGHGDAYDIAVGPEHLVVQWTSGQLEIWNRAGAQRLRTIAQDGGFRTNTTFTGATVAGSLLAQRRADGAIVLTDLDAEEALGTLTPPVEQANRKTGMALTPSADALITVAESTPETDEGGAVLTWTTSVPSWVDAACAAAGRNLTESEWRAVTRLKAPRELRCVR